ncbi:MAG: hypothetical protein M1608_02485, partial [Candidatus Omnitrophica bacterium]|nr:hypothetical protein [Candidatus Omnitrophota bacterium]
MNRHLQRGVALIITLIMLSVVTFMAVTFLALSRRERASVAVSTEQGTAIAMANEALARAQSEIVARLVARTNNFGCDFGVSTNFFNPAGFSRNLLNSNNVNYNYRADGQPLNDSDRAYNIANLQFDPRAPVYIATNKSLLYPLDFRFFLDLNRNGRFETNGLLPVLDNAGQPIKINGQFLSNYFVGDPEWIGVLDKPGLPHSATNRFVGRYAWMALPAGKSLDLNYIFNQVKALKNNWGTNALAFMRNQGIGSWELNLAAFFRDLNTNEWPPATYQYSIDPAVASKGMAFEDARDLLLYRYANRYNNLRSITTMFGSAGANAIRRDLVDNYGDGPLLPGLDVPNTDNNNPDLPWPGSDNPYRVSDIQDLFDIFAFVNTNLPARIQGEADPYTRNSSYDRYTFYRLLGQMGVDSAPALPGKMNVNYASDSAGLATNFVPWIPVDFFTNAANRILDAELTAKIPYLNPFYLDTLRSLVGTNLATGLPLAPTVADIPIYPTNYYSLLGIQQLLQEAANIYDATTNRGPAYPYWPSVFRPVFSITNGQVYINGYVEATDTSFLNNPWLDLNVPADRARLDNSQVASNANVFGIPIVIGAAPADPNFNEFALQTAVQVSRKIELRKSGPLFHPNETNQMFIIGISNLIGAEAWNSYHESYPRRLQIEVRDQCDIALTNEDTATGLWKTRMYLNNSQNIAADSWQGNEFRVPLATNVVVFTNAAYIHQSPYFVQLYNLPTFERGKGFDIPHLGLYITNRLQFIAIDQDNNRVVDFVNLDNLGSQIDLTRELIGNQSFGETSGAGSFWLTNYMAGDSIPMGVRNQILQ